MKGLLTAPLRNGVYEIPDRDTLETTLREAGWQVARIDLAHPRRVVAELGERLGFPDYYGKNLDALNDCLGDLEQPTALVVHLPLVLDAYGHALWDLLTDWAAPRTDPVIGANLRSGGVPFALVHLATDKVLGSSA